MRDGGKRNQQLMHELMQMRQRVAELEAADTERMQAEKTIEKRKCK